MDNNRRYNDWTTASLLGPFLGHNVTVCIEFIDPACRIDLPENRYLGLTLFCAPSSSNCNSTTFEAVDFLQSSS